MGSKWLIIEIVERKLEKVNSERVVACLEINSRRRIHKELGKYKTLELTKLSGYENDQKKEFQIQISTFNNLVRLIKGRLKDKEMTQSHIEMRGRKCHSCELWFKEAEKKILVYPTTSENGSQMTTSSRICFGKNFHSRSPTASLPGILENVMNSMQHCCQAYQKTSGHNFEHML
ncbi:hypothetical protein TNCV_2365451 [Trichonephila clavipes]|nr:hypothetical protein TNCV_2365451 [Trichonephila clavipes]